MRKQIGSNTGFVNYCVSKQMLRKFEIVADWFVAAIQIEKQ